MLKTLIKPSPTLAAALAFHSFHPTCYSPEVRLSLSVEDTNNKRECLGFGSRGTGLRVGAPSVLAKWREEVRPTLAALSVGPWAGEVPSLSPDFLVCEMV